MAQKNNLAQPPLREPKTKIKIADAKISDVFLLAVRIFKTQRLRTILTILGISVGIGTVLFLVSLGYGLQNILLQRFINSESLLSLDVIASEPDLVPLNQERIKGISKLPGVMEVSSLISLPGQITAQGISGNIIVNVVDQSFLRLDGIQPDQGQVFQKPGEIVITQAVGRLLNVAATTDLLGQKVGLTLFVPKSPGEEAGGIGEEVEIVRFDYPFTIVGIIEGEVNLSYSYVSITNLTRQTLPPAQQVKVKVASDEFLEPVRGEIISRGFTVSALSDTVAQANKIFKGIQVVLAIFGIIALVVSAIGMLNTMTVSLLEQTHEIGIMKSVGASSRDVWLLFCAEATIIGFAGGLGGLVIAFLGTKIFNFSVNVLARALGGQPLDLFETPVWFVIFIIVFSTVIGFLTGLWPARRAAKLDPLEALRG